MSRWKLSCFAVIYDFLCQAVPCTNCADSGRNKPILVVCICLMLVSERLLVLLKITAVFKVELWQGRNCTPRWVAETQITRSHLCRQTQGLGRFLQVSVGLSFQVLHWGSGSWDEKLRVALHRDLYIFFSVSNLATAYWNFSWVVQHLDVIQPVYFWM